MLLTEEYTDIRARVTKSNNNDFSSCCENWVRAWIGKSVVLSKYVAIRCKSASKNVEPICLKDYEIDASFSCGDTNYVVEIKFGKTERAYVTRMYKLNRKKKIIIRAGHVPIGIIVSNHCIAQEMNDFLDYSVKDSVTCGYNIYLNSFSLLEWAYRNGYIDNNLYLQYFNFLNE